VNVEDSKAQRQQRSQARFRDRGGCVRFFGAVGAALTTALRIFIPSDDNLLADILLGKASPLKKPRKSAAGGGGQADLRRSPRKQPQELVAVTPQRHPKSQGERTPAKKTPSMSLSLPLTVPHFSRIGQDTNKAP